MVVWKLAWPHPLLELEDRRCLLDCARAKVWRRSWKRRFRSFARASAAL
jgi:hypothetical protein